MKHPASTVSNIAYIIGGTWLLLDSAAWMQDYAGIMIILLGLASGAYHWTENRWAQKADIIAIFGAFNALMAWQLSTFAGFEGYNLLLFLVSLGLSVAVGFTYEDWTHKQIGFLAVQNLMVLFVRSMMSFAAALVLFLLALIIGQNAEGFNKNSSRYDRPHAVWHWLTAGGLILLGLC